MPIKLEIPNSSDWSTNTNDPMINAFRELMKENNEFVDEPNVGIFWYDPENKELFGVFYVPAQDTHYFPSTLFGTNVRTCRPMHYAVWQKECNKGKDKRFQTLDYTKYPRGRVFEVENEGFKVCVGDWIEDYPEVKDLVLTEFQLPSNTQFIIDRHWNLGHGWSDKEL